MPAEILQRIRFVPPATALLVTFLCTWNGIVHAEESREAESTSTGEASTPAAEPEGESPGPPGRPAPGSPDSFVPSEEISEDLSVSFPVDI